MENSEEKTSPEVDQNEASATARTNDNQDTPSDKNQEPNAEETASESTSDAGPVTANIENSFVLDKNILNARDMEMTELRVKVVCLEKNNMALKMELKCAELQMEAKAKIDVQKNRLIELLDGKVGSLTKKNSHLMDMMESMLKDKNSHSGRLNEATKHLEELSTKLAESERIRIELRTVNQELKSMLSNIEDKGTQIAKIAKEKLTKYKEESIKMQQELDDLKKNAIGGATPGEPGAADGDRFQPHWKKIEALQEQLDNALQGGSTGLPESVITSTRELRQELEQLRTELNANHGENNKLRSLLDNMRPIFGDLQRLGQEHKPPPTEETVGKDQEIAQLRERLDQLSSTIAKLISLGGTALAQ